MSEPMDPELQKVFFTKSYEEKCRLFTETMNKIEINKMNSFEFVDFYEYFKHLMKFLKNQAAKRGIIVKD